MMMQQCALVAAGGALGAVGRYLMGLAPFIPKTSFPAATLLVNLIGAVLIGAVAQAAAQKGLGNDAVVLFLKVGVCGGFTHLFFLFAGSCGPVFRRKNGAGRGVYRAERGPVPAGRAAGAVAGAETRMNAKEQLK